MTKNGFTAIATPRSIPGTTSDLVALPGLQGKIYLADELSSGSFGGESLLAFDISGSVDGADDNGGDSIACVASANGLAADAVNFRFHFKRDRTRRSFS
jgi:hypothetical protein